MRYAPFGQGYDYRLNRYESMYGIAIDVDDESKPPQLLNFSVFISKINRVRFSKAELPIVNAIVNLLSNLQSKLGDINTLLRRLDWISYLLSASVLSYTVYEDEVPIIAVSDIDAYVHFQKDAQELIARSDRDVSRTFMSFRKGGLFSLMTGTKPQTIDLFPLDNKVLIGPWKKIWEFQEFCDRYVISKMFLSKGYYTKSDRIAWAKKGIGSFGTAIANIIDDSKVTVVPLAGTLFYQQFSLFMNNFGKERFGEHNLLVYRGTRATLNGYSYTSTVTSVDQSISFQNYIDSVTNGGLYVLLNDIISLGIIFPLCVKEKVVDADTSEPIAIGEIVLDANDMSISPVNISHIWEDTNKDITINGHVINALTDKIYSILSTSASIKVLDIAELYKVLNKIEVRLNYAFVDFIPRMKRT